jgi:GH35 family endo-1,4-beta-xylanase
MINRNLITTFFLIVATAISAYGQGNTSPALQKSLKEAYAGKFFIGAADDLSRISEAEAANIKMHYDIITPENCMKPQPIHPSEDTYNFVTTDAMVDWCQKNGLKVWGHTLAWHSQSGHGSSRKRIQRQQKQLSLQLLLQLLPQQQQILLVPAPTWQVAVVVIQARRQVVKLFWNV